MKKKLILAVLAVVTVFAAWEGYHYYRSQCIKVAQPCWTELGQIEGAKEQWALEHKAAPGTTVTLADISPYLNPMPKCNVASGRYIIGNVGEEPQCTVHGTQLNFKPDHY